MNVMILCILGKDQSIASDSQMLEVLSLQKIHGEWTLDDKLATAINIPVDQLKTTDIVQVGVAKKIS